MVLFFSQASELFYHFSKDDEANIMSLIKERKLVHAITLHPINDPVTMYKIHRYLTELELNKTFVETRTLQNAIKDMLPYLPDGKGYNNIYLPYFIGHKLSAFYRSFV